MEEIVNRQFPKKLPFQQGLMIQIELLDQSKLPRMGSCSLANEKYVVTLIHNSLP